MYCSQEELIFKWINNVYVNELIKRIIYNNTCYYDVYIFYNLKMIMYGDILNWNEKNYANVNNFNYYIYLLFN